MFSNHDWWQLESQSCHSNLVALFQKISLLLYWVSRKWRIKSRLLFIYKGEGASKAERRGEGVCILSATTHNFCSWLWRFFKILICRSVGEKKCRCIQMDFSRYVVWFIPSKTERNPYNTWTLYYLQLEIYSHTTQLFLGSLTGTRIFHLPVLRY